MGGGNSTCVELPGEELMTETLLSDVSGLSQKAEPPDKTFDAIVFDWDGTAIPNRHANAESLRCRVEALCRAGLDIVIVSGTHVGNVDDQLKARPDGPGRLWLCVNRGSQVALVGPDGPEFVFEREASKSENLALDRAADSLVQRLGTHGLDTRVISRRMNRRKIDLMDDPQWEDPPKSQIGSLLAAVTERLITHGISGLDAVVELATCVAQEAGLTDPRVTTDAKHIEIGLTDKSDSLRWILNELSGRGVGPGLVLIVGDEMGPLGGAAGSDGAMLIPQASRATAISVGVEPEGVPESVIHMPGGPEAFLSLLDKQLVRRATKRVPSLDFDPSWTFVWNSKRSNLERVRESLLTVSDGRFGTRGYREEDGSSSNPMVISAGIYNEVGGVENYLIGPRWADLELDAQHHDNEWVLDLRSGVLLRTQRDRHGGVEFRSMRFASMGRPGAMALRAEGRTSQLEPGISLVVPRDTRSSHGISANTYWASTESSFGGGITAAAKTNTHTAHGLRLIERLAHYISDKEEVPDPTAVMSALDHDVHVGFDQLLARHRHNWAKRWSRAMVAISGDPDAELAVRFALFHLMACASDEGEAPVGARGLSGPAYAGHVFWDTEVFLLPFFAATHAPSAEAILRYRLARLDAARENAESTNRRGARFPWESATTGKDVTPQSAQDAHGETVSILTGHAEEHIVADIAWAAWLTATWTGDMGFLLGVGRPLIIDTARWWASRAERDPDGTAHLRGVIGPDEYHELVDDNAFTNVMAAWNLRRAAELAELIVDSGEPIDITAAEMSDWQTLADALVDGYDNETGLYEQFAGFTSLEPLIIAELATPPVAADVLLGRQRIAGSQVIKQPDVLMLHHLVPQACEPGSLEPNLAFYGPRTAHGSSLSPAIHASLLARAGRANEALEFFHLACRIDLDDLTGTTAGGLHMACLGGIWQALAFGFIGLQATPDGLVIDPHLPDAWDSLEMTVVFRGARVTIHVEGETITISPDAPVPVVIDRVVALVQPPGEKLLRQQHGQEEKGEHHQRKKTESP